MSMHDPIADMLTRIRNAQLVGHAEVAMPASRLKASIAKVLKDEGYIDDYALRDSGPKKELAIALKYYAGRPVIDRTGLAGSYRVDFTFDSAAARGLGPGSRPPSNAPSLFTALPEQLGLKLEPARADMPTLVVDRLERPTPN